MGNTFKTVYLCVAVDSQNEAENLKRWVEANGGKHSKEVTEDVTHLITTKEAVKKGNPQVQKARRTKGVKIVSASWLEDSLVSKNRRPKREDSYLLVRPPKDRKGRKALVRKQAKVATPKSPGTKPKDMRSAFQILIDEFKADGYHLYKDDSDFTYYVTLARPSSPSSSPSRKSRYYIMILESDEPPRTYAAFIKYTQSSKVGTHFLSPQGSTLSAAHTAFQKFFKQKTGKKWEYRSDGKVPSSKKGNDGSLLPADQGWFEVELPKGAAIPATLSPPVSEPDLL